MLIGYINSKCHTNKLKGALGTIRIYAMVQLKNDMHIRICNTRGHFAIQNAMTIQ